MDPPIAAQLFRRLSRQPVCQHRRNLALLASSLQHARLQRHLQRRTLSSRRPPDDPGSNESNWQQRTEIFQEDMTEEYQNATLVTSNDLKLRRERPRGVKMLMRDFIEGSSAAFVSRPPHSS
jgi:hypothetical protein